MEIRRPPGIQMRVIYREEVRSGGHRGEGWLPFRTCKSREGRDEGCKVIKANVRHLVEDLKARNFL